MKNYLIGFLVGAIIFGSFRVYATIKLSSDEVGYKDTTVENALDNLYDNLCTDWEEIKGALITDASYLYGGTENNKLYKCGNVCKISFSLNSTSSINVNYKLINDEKYYPKEEVYFSGIGHSYGYAYFILKTNGNIVVTEQSKAIGGWASAENIAYICD